MTRFDRYVMRAVIRALVLVLVLLLGLAWLVEWLDQRSATVGLDLAFLYAGLTMPRRLHELLPFIGLLGVVLGLGTLATSNELDAARASGISARRVLAAAVFPVALLALGGEALNEWAMPRAEGSLAAIQARQQNPRAGGYPARSEGELPLRWTRVGNAIVAARAFDGDRELYDVTAFAFDGTALAAWWHAPVVQIGQGSTTTASAKLRTSTLFRTDGVQRTTTAIGDTGLVLSAAMFSATSPRDALGMSLRALVRWLDGDLDPEGAPESLERQFAVTLWRRIAQLPATLLLAFVGGCLVFGSARRTSLGSRLAGAALTGIAFKYAGDLTAPIVLLSGAPACMAALAPLCLMAVAAVVALRITH